MKRIVFLLEEDSMKVLLEGLLPRLMPDLTFQCLAHEGKQDLEKSVPRKLRAWREPGVRFVIVRDQDGGDCRVIKSSLTRLCRESGRKDVLVRIVCREVEAWYVGDTEALGRAFPETRPNVLRTLAGSRFRIPDNVVHPSDAIAKAIPEFQKRSGARRMAAVLSRENRSRSFRAFVSGVERLWASMQAEPC